MNTFETLALSVSVTNDKLSDAMSYRKTDSAPGRNPNADLSPMIKAAIRGDRLAMEKLFQHFKTPIYNLAYRYTYNAAAAEDILQDVFIKVFTHLDDVKNIETFTGWVFRIALNTCYSHLRGKRVELEKTVPMAAVEGTRHEARVDAEENDVRKPLDEAIAGQAASDGSSRGSSRACWAMSSKSSSRSWQSSQNFRWSWSLSISSGARIPSR
jgi:hypothetical protein